MGGICHRSVPDRFLAEIWETLLAYPHVSEWPGPWPEHIWLGTTSGDPRTKYRPDHLRRSRAQVRFVSAEPLLGSMLPVDLSGIHHVIVGGESGPGSARCRWSGRGNR
jgi:protein gp37